MLAKLRSRLSALRRDCRGASIVEFAAVAPVMGFMVMGITDIARGFSARLVLEQAGYRALEKVAVGSVQSDYNYLKAEAATAANVPQSQVTVDNWLECDRVRQSDFNGTCTTGMVSRYVRITVNSNFRPSFNYGPLGQSFGQRSSDGTIAISATTSLRVQ